MAITTLADIVTEVRYITGDVAVVGKDIFTYGNSAVFTLEESNVSSVDSVFVNDIEIGESEYSYDSATNKVTITATLSTSDPVEFNYTYFPNYSDTELQGYIQNAIMQLSIHNYKDFEVIDNVIQPAPELKEKNLLAIIAGILIEPENKSYRLPDVSISIGGNVLSTFDRISKTIAIFKKNCTGVYEII